MKFKAVHNNYNVFDLDKSLVFYDNALGLKEVRRIAPNEGNFIIVYLQNDESAHQVELTWLKEWTKPYDLGDNEIHMAFTTPNYEEAHSHHKNMNCIIYENNAMGIYFIADPDGYWIEIMPEKK